MGLNSLIGLIRLVFLEEATYSLTGSHRRPLLCGSPGGRPESGREYSLGEARVEGVGPPHGPLT